MKTTQAHMSHWGAFVPQSDGRDVTAIAPYAADPDPSALLANIPGSVTHRARVTTPAIRRGWLESGPGATTMRGRDEFVAVPWDEALDLLAGELTRVKAGWGNEAIFGGSYGWASAGLFHVPQYQLHRLLNCFGGYSRSVNSYSLGASQVILPHVLGSLNVIFDGATSWDVIVEHTELLVAFGGISSKNSAVAGGGVSRHVQRDHLRAAHRAGMEMVCVSPVRDDLGGDAVEWVPLVPGTDVALMAALGYVLATEELHDTAFLERCCVGYEQFERYLIGDEDGTPKTPEWAAAITGIAADEIRGLARRMAAKRTLITVSWSLQRVEHGEQGPWMALALASMLGQIGVRGGGFGHGYGSTASVGMNPPGIGFPRYPQGANPVESFIPVARIADMLLHPGEPFEYDGRTHTYPAVRLVYWAGGNPFHHHQDLGRLRRALGELDTLVVHEQYWTATARHADIVLPCTTTLERDDLGAMSTDSRMFAMQQVVPPFAGASDDYAIFAELAKRLGIWSDFSEGRDAQEWLRHMYDTWRTDIAGGAGIDVPPFDEFWAAGELDVPTVPARIMLADFRDDPDAHPLATPSGRIEITSAVVDAFGYDDCPGHPTWIEPQEWLGAPAAAKWPLVLLANQPSTRLHSQLDIGATSQSSKVAGREPARIHPADAAARGFGDGDVVRIFNGRGSLLAGAVLSEQVRAGAVQLSTGAWYDPLDPDDVHSMCVHGNPNVLTRDAGTSQLAQGCTGAHALVEVERWDGAVPVVQAFEPPPLRQR